MENGKKNQEFNRLQKLVKFQEKAW